MIKKICPSCKKFFITEKESQIYCNQKCYSKSNKLKEDAKNCPLIKNNNNNKWHLGHLKENVSYGAMHDWVRYHKDKTGECAICGRKDSGIEGRDFDLANLSGKYLRDVDDYEWLCVWCHNTFDRFVKKGLFNVIGVESKKSKYLDAKEKAMATWYLDNNIFSKIYIAHPIKQGRHTQIVYQNFER
jgi:hypothetical protein